jgi:hypothetical protein
MTIRHFLQQFPLYIERTGERMNDASPFPLCLGLSSGKFFKPMQSTLGIAERTQQVVVAHRTVSFFIDYVTVYLVVVLDVNGLKKGTTLLALWGFEGKRFTRDIDLLAFGAAL